MDYFSNVKQEYYIDFDVAQEHAGAYCFLANGNVEYVDYDNVYFDNLCGYFANYCNRTYNSSCLGFLYRSSDLNTAYNGTSLLFVGSDRMDYVVTYSSGSNVTLELSSLYHNDDHANVLDLGVCLGYPQFNPNNSFSSSSVIYGSYDKQITNEMYSVIDYSSLVEYTESNINFLAGLDNNFVVRGENINYHKYPVLVRATQLSELYFSYGSPYSDLYRQGYQSGSGAGYATGRVDGFDEGYQTGLNAGGANIGSQQATAFSYIGTAFGVVSDVLSIQVLPNITLGLCFSIPLVFVLIMTIFKLVRK